MSAFDDAVPLCIEGAFLGALFLSFLARIVSVLGFNLMLPPASPRPPDLSALSCDWGMEATVSVSTVMFLVPSPALDRAERGGTVFVGARRGFNWLIDGGCCLLPRPSLLFPSLSLSMMRGCLSAANSSLLAG